MTDVHNHSSIFRFRIWLALPVTDHAGKRAHRIPPFSVRGKQRPDTAEWQKSILQLLE